MVIVSPFFFLFFFLGVNRVKLLDIRYILGFEGKISGGYSYIFTVAHFFKCRHRCMIWMYMKPTLQLYIYISNSVPSFIPAMYNVLPIAKRHSGIFLCHSILHVALHKHFVLTNGHVCFFWTILIPGCLFTTKFYYCFIYIELVSFFLIWIKSLYPWPDTCTRWLVQH